MGNQSVLPVWWRSRVQLCSCASYRFGSNLVLYTVPTRTGQVGRHFPVKEFWTQNIENSGNFRKIFFFSDYYQIFKWIVYYLLKWIKNIGKWEKYWKSRGILSIRKSGNHVVTLTDFCCINTHLIRLMLISTRLIREYELLFTDYDTLTLSMLTKGNCKCVSFGHIIWIWFGILSIKIYFIKYGKWLVLFSRTFLSNGWYYRDGSFGIQYNVYHTWSWIQP